MRELQELALNIKKETWKQPDSWADFVGKVADLEHSDEYVVHFRGFDPSGQQPCVLFVQRGERQAWLRQYLPDIIFVDSTHGTNNHNMQLYTAVIPCDARQGLPAAFCLMYAPGVSIMTMLQLQPCSAMLHMCALCDLLVNDEV